MRLYLDREHECYRQLSEQSATAKFPRNGLCLSTLHDAAFDDGLITLDEKLCLVLNKRLRSYFPQILLEQSFVPFEGKPIRLPEKTAEPNPDFLRHHRDAIFSKKR